MTYSIYLSEHFTTGVYRTLFASRTFAIQLCGIVGLLAVTYLISWVSYITVEQKFGSWLREKLL
jgi:peptidoglycan/LPS O-acetylase OafA/YrhL